jgi:hypothetical protein
MIQSARSFCPHKGVCGFLQRYVISGVASLYQVFNNRSEFAEDVSMYPPTNQLL